MISLVIVNYNQGRYLGKAIASILEQTRQDWELLIWDDGSTDNSVVIARKYQKQDERIRVIAATNQGFTKGLKNAIAKTTGDYIGWIDSDDWIANTAVEETAKVLDSHPPVGMVYTDYYDVNSRGKILGTGKPCNIPYSPQRLLVDFMTFHFRLFRREVYEQIGGINTNLKYAQDYDLCLRLSEIIDFARVKKPLYYYRHHRQSISYTKRKEQTQCSEQLINQALQRRGLADNYILQVEGDCFYLRKKERGTRNEEKTTSLSQSPNLPVALSKLFKTAITVLPFTAALSLQPASAQQIIPNNDGTMTVITKDGSTFNIDGGTLSGDGKNLFHSFREFGLDAGQIANFLSNPNIQNILGRINGGNPSIINGLIQVSGGNSNLFLMNPSGIIFGNNASLNVPGDFTATTATGIGFGSGWFNAVGTNDYLNLVGNPNSFNFSNSESGVIINAGNLAVDGDSNISLTGGTVINTGTIETEGGNITIAAVPNTNRIRISQRGQLLSIEVAVPQDANGQPLAIRAMDLPNLLRGLPVDIDTRLAVAANDDVTVANSKTVIPNEPGTTIVSGTVDVSSDIQSGKIGGEAQLLGDKVGLIGANVDASGDDGGGTVLAGGEYKGQGTLPTAEVTLVDSNSTIQADALQTGDGGEVIVWADNTTKFNGTISARGGNVNGDGGFVEISGKENLSFQGSVDLSSEKGNLGTLLLDPENITIVDGDGSGEPNLEDGALPDIFQIDFSGQDITISELALEGLPETANVILEATNDITINDLSDDLLGFQTTTGSVTFRADADQDNGGSFIVTNSINIETQGGNVTIEAASFESTDSLDIRTNGGDITLNAAGNITTGEIDSSSSGTGRGGNITLQSTGGAINTTSGDIDSGSNTGEGGSITFTAAGNINTIDVNAGGFNTSAGGNITFDSGSMITTATDAFIESTSAGNGGIIRLSADDGIELGGNIVTASTGGGTGGNITLTSSSGGIATQFLNANSNGGAVGTVTLTAAGDITTGSINSGNNPTQGADITLTSTGGTVNITNATLNSSGGDINIFGTGSASLATSAFGVDLRGAVLNSGNGNINLTGTGGGNGNGGSNSGVNIQSGTKVESTGTGAITIVGTGGIGGIDTSNNRGISVTGGSTEIKSVDGTISLTGTANDTTSGDNNSGIDIRGGATVASTGTGTIRLEGRGGGGTDNNIGINIGGDPGGGATTVESTGTGTIRLEGTSGTGTTQNHGIRIVNSSSVISADGDITLIGTAATNNGDLNHGVFILGIPTGGEDSLVETTGTGSIQITGVSNATGGTQFGNDGISIVDGGQVRATGEGTITLTGTGGLEGSSELDGNQGIVVLGTSFANSFIESNTGDITLTGTGRGTGTNNFGIFLAAGGDGRIESTAGSNISLTGIGSNSPGILFRDGAIIDGGNISLTADEITNGATTTPATIQGTGTLQIQPNTDNLGISIGGNIDDTRLNLNDSELDSIQNGFSQIIIGDGTGTLTVDSGGVFFNDSVTLQADNIQVDGRIEGRGDASIAVIGSGTTTTLNADITTQGEPIEINDNVILPLDVDIELDTTLDEDGVGADITINGKVNGVPPEPDSNAGDLTLTAGDGAIEITGAIGDTNAIGDIVANSTSTTTFGSTVNAESLFTNSGGTTILNGNLTTTGDQTYNDGVRLGTSTILTSANSNITLNEVDFNGVGENSNLTIAAGDSINLDGAIRDSTPGNDSLNLDLTANTSVSIDSNINANGGNINITADTMDLQANSEEVENIFTSNELVLQPFTPSRNINLETDPNNPPPDALNFANGRIGELSKNVNSITIGRTNGTGTITVTDDFNDGLTVESNLTLRTSQTAGAIVINDAIEASETIEGSEAPNLNKDVTLNAGTNVDINQDITSNGGKITINSGGTIDTTSSFILSGSTLGAGGDINLTAQNDINTGSIVSGSRGSNGGKITLRSNQGAIDTTAPSRFVLGGNQEIPVENGVIASASANGNGGAIELNAAGDITTGTIFSSSLAGDGNGGDITLISQNGTIDTTKTTAIRVSETNEISGLDATTSSVAATATGGEITLTTSRNITPQNITTNNNNVNLNGAVSLNQDTTITSNGTGDINFNSTVDGTNNLILNAGSGNTIFNGVVGANTPLSSLTTNGEGTTQLNANITTAGDQTYNNGVAVGNDPTLEGANITLNQVDFNGVGENGNLTIRAGDNININGAIADSASGGDSLNLDFTANTNEDNIGKIAISQPVNTGSGDISLTNTSVDDVAIDIQNPLNSDGGNITLIGSSTNNTGVLIDSSINANGGDITITGTSVTEDGVFINRGEITTIDAGRIEITGTSTQDNGIETLGISGAEGVPTTITTANGEINLTGTSTEGTGVNTQITNITSTEGAINITGTSSDNDGILIDNTDISTNSNVTLTADEIDLINNTTLRGDTITLEPETPELAIAVASDTQSDNVLDITEAELNTIQAGTNSVIIGREEDGSGTITVLGEIGNGTFDISSDLTLRTPATNGAILVNGAISLNDSQNLTLDAGTIVNINEDLTTDNGVITITSKGDININTDEVNSDGGAISITTSNGGNIDTRQAVLSSSSEIEGGTIDITATGNINVGIVNSGSTNANGGNITINSTGGAINATIPVPVSEDSTETVLFGFLTSGTIGENGGNITLQAEGDITTGFIYSGSLGTGTGGTISVTSNNGNIDTTVGANLPPNIEDIADLPADLPPGVISTVFTGVSSFSTNNGGNINLTANNGNITSSDVNASGAATGGEVTLNTSSGNIITPENITTTNNNINLEGAVTLAQDTKITVVRTDNFVVGTDKDNITFNNTVDGEQTLTVETAAGDAFFNNAVGGINALSSLSVESGVNTTILNGNVTTTGDQKFDGNITTSTDTALNSSNGNITTQDITTSGRNLNITANSISTQDITTEGGNVGLRSTSGAISTENINSSGTTGGNVTLNSASTIATRAINARGTAGDGGDVTLNSGDNSNIRVASIRADGTNNGGNIEVNANSENPGLFVADSFLEDGTTSILTNNPGTITIQHGGDGIIPFEVAEPNLLQRTNPNGTVGAIVAGGGNSQINEGAFLFSKQQGNIRIISVDDDGLEQQLNTVLNRSEDQPREVINSDSDQALVESPLMIASIPEARETLQNIAREAAQKPALVYVNFTSSQIPTAADNSEEYFRRAENCLTEEFKQALNLQGTQTAPTICLAAQPTDQLEVLVVTPEGEPIYFKSDVTREEVEEQAEELYLEVSDNEIGWREPSQQLYQWLIGDIEEELATREIDNLLFVLPPKLRSLPIAALYDGRNREFLVQKGYNVGLAPSINLMNTIYEKEIQDAEVLALGASDFTEEQQQIPLNAVEVELNEIIALRGGNDPILNEQFTLPNLKNTLDKNSLSIVHLATHANFDADNIDNIYIQLYDQKLTLDQVKALNIKVGDTERELLVLSACRSAFGNVDAELGFAGLAIKLGFKTAIGSLWYVEDVTNPGLMAEFYHQLKTNPFKAEALRLAQVAMIEGKMRIDLEARQITTSWGETIELPEEAVAALTDQGIDRLNLSHPYYWAPFTVIGSPW